MTFTQCKFSRYSTNFQKIVMFRDAGLYFTILATEIVSDCTIFKFGRKIGFYGTGQTPTLLHTKMRNFARLKNMLVLVIQIVKTKFTLENKSFSWFNGSKPN